jgi:predicted transcriptional regulator of viral defense system
MSTSRTNIKNNRFLNLSRLGEQVFHVSDLANIWDVKDKNTLNTSLKRYASQGLLYRVYRGMYSILPLEKIDPYLLGVKALHEYAYISCETILWQKGIISQPATSIALISARSKRFKIGKQDYYSRSLKDDFLFQNIGIEKMSSVNFATPERAAADMLYYNPKAHFDSPGLVDWEKVSQIQKTIGYPAVNYAKNI